MQNMITVKNLVKEFKLKNNTITAVDNINFSINKGEKVAFIGPNGAGKSTTIKMLSGILYPSSGKVSVCGYTPSTQRQKLSYQIGTVFGQRSQLWVHLPVLDSYKVLASLYDIEKDIFKKRLDQLLNIFSLQEIAKQRVKELSLGQRMKCEIVASLLHSPKVLFLDEPSIGLDATAKKSIRELINHYAQEEKKTILLTSHDTDDIEMVCDRIILINSGKIVIDKSIEAFKEKYIRRKYLSIEYKKEVSDSVFKNFKIISNEKNIITIEYDSKKQTIKEILELIDNDLPIKDINISNPSLESIILDIYQEK